jgi:hypothetical protein
VPKWLAALRGPKSPEPVRPGQASPPAWRQLPQVTFSHTRGEARIEAVGEQHHAAAVAAFIKFTGSGVGKAILVRQRNNPRASNAIAVYGVISAEPGAALVGYLSMQDALAYRPVFEYLGEKVIGCNAAVTPHRRGAGTDRVVLHLGTPGELIAELWAEDHPIAPGHPWMGKVVAFSGFGLKLAGVTLDREAQRLLARLAGCVVAPRVTKKTQLCVNGELGVETTNTIKARDYGIPVLEEPDFWFALGVEATALGQSPGWLGAAAVVSTGWIGQDEDPAWVGLDEDPGLPRH